MCYNYKKSYYKDDYEKANIKKQSGFSLAELTLFIDIQCIMITHACQQEGLKFVGSG